MEAIAKIKIVISCTQGKKGSPLTEIMDRHLNRQLKEVKIEYADMVKIAKKRTMVVLSIILEMTDPPSM
jgi:hypothetical protein